MLCCVFFFFFFFSDTYRLLSQEFGKPNSFPILGTCISKCITSGFSQYILYLQQLCLTEKHQERWALLLLLLAWERKIIWKSNIWVSDFITSLTIIYFWTIQQQKKLAIIWCWCLLAEHQLFWDSITWLSGFTRSCACWRNILRISVNQKC